MNMSIAEKPAKGYQLYKTNEVDMIMHQRSSLMKENLSIIKDLNDMKEKNKKLYQLNGKLMKENDELREELQRLRAFRDERISEYYKLEEENEKLDERNKGLSSVVKRLQDYNDRLFNKLKENSTSDKEVEELNELLRISSEENENLKIENMRLEAKSHSFEITYNTLKDKSDKVGGGILEKGDEKELYDGEYKDIILDILHQALNGLNQIQRRHAILKSILDKNKEVGNRKRIINALSNTIIGESPNALMRNRLKDIGFYLERDNNHYKVGFISNPAWYFSLSATSSDIRGNINTISDAKRILF